MKAVLISIKPKWCDLIRRGRKTVEVRKTCPKLEVPFKVYIYETMDGGRGSGLVFGEFVCIGFDVFRPIGKGISIKRFPALYESCLTLDEIVKYKPAGSVAFAELPSLSESILGNVYNVTDAFTTTANFVEDAGNKHPKGTNVVVVKVGDAYKYDVLAGFVDLSGYVEKEAGKGLSDENFTAALKDKLDGIAAGANKYVHPTHTAAASGLYKTTVDEEGHVTATTPVTKDDITKLGIPAQDTTYDEATTAKAGLMSAADKTKLDGMGATINKAIADHTATDAEVSEMLAEVYGE